MVEMYFQMRHVYIFLLGFLLAAQGCVNSKQPIQKTADGAWTFVESEDGSKPEARHEAGFAGIGDRFYLLGGRGIKPTSIYDFNERKWIQGAPPPLELHHFQPVVHDGLIYVAGAMTGPYPGETPVENIYIYDPDSDAWHQGPSIPQARLRGGAGAVVKEGSLYLLCGIQDGHRGGHVSWLDVYDFTTGTWTVLPDAPRPRDHFQAAIVGDHLYGIAGRTTMAADNPFKNTIGAVDVFDIRSNKWTTLSNILPTERAGNAALAIGTDILVLGGESFNQEIAHSEVEVLDTRTGSWTSWPDLVRGRHGTGVLWYHGSLYMASGCGNRGGTPELSDLIKFSLD